MLVLTRRTEESLIIGTDIIVTVLRARDGRVRLGLLAPREIAVRRAELPAAAATDCLLRGKDASAPADERAAE
jgi:carbon storage regulator